MDNRKISGDSKQEPVVIPHPPSPQYQPLRQIGSFTASTSPPPSPDGTPATVISVAKDFETAKLHIQLKKGDGSSTIFSITAKEDKRSLFVKVLVAIKRWLTKGQVSCKEVKIKLFGSSKETTFLIDIANLAQLKQMGIGEEHLGLSAAEEREKVEIADLKQEIPKLKKDVDEKLAELKKLFSEDWKEVEQELLKKGKLPDELEVQTLVPLMADKLLILKGQISAKAWEWVEENLPTKDPEQMKYYLTPEGHLKIPFPLKFHMNTSKNDQEVEAIVKSYEEALKKLQEKQFRLLVLENRKKWVKDAQKGPVTITKYSEAGSEALKTLADSQSLRYDFGIRGIVVTTEGDICVHRDNDKLLGKGLMKRYYEAEVYGTGKPCAWSIIRKDDAVEELCSNPLLPGFEKAIKGKSQFAKILKFEFITKNRSNKNRKIKGYIVTSVRKAADAFSYPVLTGNNFLRLLEGYAFMHKLGYVHRDIKPGNLEIDRGDIVYITDFDTLARIGKPVSISTGTPGYMDVSQEVELILGLKPKPNPKGDVRALGYTLEWDANRAYVPPGFSFKKTGEYALKMIEILKVIRPDLIQQLGKEVFAEMGASAHPDVLTSKMLDKILEHLRGDPKLIEEVQKERTKQQAAEYETANPEPDPINEPYLHLKWAMKHPNDERTPTMEEARVEFQRLFEASLVPPTSKKHLS